MAILSHKSIDSRRGATGREKRKGTDLIPKGFLRYHRSNVSSQRVLRPGCSVEKKTQGGRPGDVETGKEPVKSLV